MKQYHFSYSGRGVKFKVGIEAKSLSEALEKFASYCRASDDTFTIEVCVFTVEKNTTNS